jgi:septal ring factor EnvC (AmiA/AmiB activator)
MDYLRIVALSLLAVLSWGCKYGPEHLPPLRTQRDALIKIVSDIERQNGLSSSLPGVAEAQQQVAAAKETIEAIAKSLDESKQRSAQLEKEVQRLNENLKLFDDSWFKTLNTDQQLQWRMHRDMLEAGAKSELHQVVELKGTAQSK